MDHYACYKVKTTKGTPKLPEGLEATIGDQLTTPPRRYAVKKPTRLCTPVEKNGEIVKHAADHLLCYQVKATKKRCSAASPANPGVGCKKEIDCGGVNGQTSLCGAQPKFAATPALRTSNQFGTETLDALKDGELCLPSQPL